jgi:SAM-dependent methyltransferase
MSAEPWSPEAFEARYRADPDPWKFATSPYEQARYDALLEALPRPTYARAYEPGCSIGALTVRLAPRCGELFSVDVSPSAVARARNRCMGLSEVHVAVGSVGDEPPPDLDLVVFSEIGYYFTVSELDQIIARVAGAMRAGGVLVACHWLGTSDDHQLHGSVVHDCLHQQLNGAYRPVHHFDGVGFVLDAWTRDV